MDDETLEDNGECGLRVKIKTCNITNDADGIFVDTTEATGIAGCGLMQDAGDDCKLSIKRSSLIQANGGLENGSGTCDIRVKVGCGLDIGAPGVSVDRNDLMQAGGFIIAGSGTCDMKVDTETTDLIKSIDSIVLDLDGSNNLRVTLNYTKLASAIVIRDGTPSSENVSDTHPTTVCP